MDYQKEHRNLTAEEQAEFTAELGRRATARLMRDGECSIYDDADAIFAEIIARRTPAVGWWVPKKGEVYWLVDGDGEVELTWNDGSDFHHKRFATGNCYRTKEEANAAARYEAAARRLRRMVETCNGGARVAKGDDGKAWFILGRKGVDWNDRDWSANLGILTVATKEQAEAIYNALREQGDIDVLFGRAE